MLLDFSQQNNNFYQSLDDITLGVIGVEDEITAKFKKNIFQERQPILLNQVHQKDILLIDENSLSTQKWLTANYDGVISSLSNIVLVVKTADCIPLLFWQDAPKEFSEKKTDNFRYIAALHCGWRSVAKGIIKELVTFSQKLDIPLKCWKICLAPGIQAKNYPVGEELLSEFSPLIAQLGNNKDDFFVDPSYYSSGGKITSSYVEKKQLCFDLKKIILRQLLYLGFSAESIYDFSLCTYSEKSLYSHRQNQTKGRNFNFIFNKT